MSPIRFLPLLAAVLGMLAAAQAGAGTLQQVLARGTLRVGVVVAAPWTILDEETAELAGFEIDVARKLAADLDVEVEFVRYAHDRLVRAVEANEIDIIAAGLTISPERLRHVNFSQPYATGGIGMATNIMSTASVDRLENLNSPEFTIAVMAESTGEDLARRILSRARIEPYRSEADAAAALVAGDADVYLDEEPIPTFLALENPRTVDAPLREPLLETRSAFAVVKGDPDFVFYLNAWIEAREADTWLPTTYAYWFESLRWRD